jgi:mRNA-degrading endonuclease RelE of RelBE toxin-antitoxin system
MNVEYSKAFEKSARKLSGKVLKSVQKTIIEVKEAKKVEEISNCIKLSGFANTYRIRIGGLRAFFILRISEDSVIFEYLAPRGGAYSQKILTNLRSKDQI